MTEYLGDSGSGTRVARAGVAPPCTTGYASCSGDTFYCTTSYSDTKQLSGMPFLLVTGNWISYKSYHFEDGVKVYSQCKDSYYGQYFGASYSAKPTEEVCLSRPEISNTSLSGVYMDDKGNKYVTIHGCIYEATGDVISCSNDSTHCSATWKPLTVDPSYSDKEDTEDKGDSGDTDDKGNNGNTDGGDNSGGSSGGSTSGGSSGGSTSGGSSGGSTSGGSSGGSTSGGSSGGSTSGGSSGGSTSGGSSGGSTSGGSSGGSTSGGSSGGSTSGGSSGGSTSGGSSSGDDDGWLGDILGWLQRIWSSVNDLNSVFSFSQTDVNNALNTFDDQLKDIVNSDDEDSTDDYDSLTSGFIDKLPKEWLFIDFDKLFFTSEQQGAQPIEINFSFSLPVIGIVHFSIDTTDFSSAYDLLLRPVLEYFIYVLTIFRLYFVYRRALMRHAEV
ncbi:TPA: hypothetical protein JWK76_005318 [Escherichia coli]|uniref:hypothetical protein n=1 Tax=Escherichia coli TaxID=562 RepID=UPI00098CA840|nr:hypothetical protein [Escherichia coli]EFJ5716359.1 hypothetical protein [Escherichia coli]EIQ9796590.1 hypothetical protein [Escherichia coli]EJJ5494858.1 hypothetical protein [Escherichia coli]EKM2785544.1 hypothetical protein [Escherichia coli]MEC4938316.1 hypothetical protein [Escherichia coli]